MKDFFISYNHADQAWAEWIAWQLEQASYSTVIQAWDFHAGSNFVLDMQRGLAEAKRVIAVLSPNYLASRFTQPEWAAAFAQDPTGEKGTLVPVRVRECDLQGLLPQIVYIDLVGLDGPTAHDKLLADVRRERAKPTTAPAFPPPAATAAARHFPGALPPIWNVPLNRNPNFTGREKYLADLHTALTADRAAALTQTQAVHGLGGVGKTQLALEYAYRHASEYDIVWWVHAEQSATLAADFARLAGELNLAEKDARDQNVVVQAVRNELQHRQAWLLIFDNATRPTDLHDFLPQGGGHVIITSRHHAWRGVASPLPVETMERREAIDFLLKRTNQSDRTAADKLAEALGDLPLALEQAGAFIEERDASLAEYAAIFSARRTELLQANAPLDYTGTVATTWNLSFEQVEAESSAASALMDLCAFFAPDDIPLDLLKKGAAHLPEVLAEPVADEYEFSNAIAPLLRFSLVAKTGETISVHRLVQAVARDRLPEAERKEYAGAAAQIVDDAFPSGEWTSELASWDVCARLLPHALATADYAAALSVVPGATGHLFNQAAVYLRVRAQFVEARRHVERALAIDEATYGKDHPNVAAIVNNLGNVLHDLGDLAGARQCLERALAIDEATYGKDHPGVATDVNNLGLVLHDLGDLPGARQYFERALAIGEATYGKDHPNVAIRVNNLGNVLHDLGDLAGARQCFERALAIDEATYGKDHPDVAIDVNNLGSVLHDLGDPAGARQCFERALAIDEATYGKDHPDVATIVNNLGSVLRDLGDLAGARQYFERALAIDEATYGKDHPRVATDVNNLGMVLRDLGDLAGARQCSERALAIDGATYGKDHPDVARDVNNLGNVLHALGDLQGARQCFERALNILVESLGENHPKTVTVRDNLKALEEKMQ